MQPYLHLPEPTLSHLADRIKRWRENPQSTEKELIELMLRVEQEIRDLACVCYLASMN
jgi:hypothetical protein